MFPIKSSPYNFHSIPSAQSSPSGSLCIGEENRYRLEQQLGEGGMGHVFLATDKRLNKPVAFKLLRESLADDRSMRIRFDWELKICASLKSEHIVQVSDYGITEGGYPFYIMEYLEGETLAQRLKYTPRLSPEETCLIISQVCAGLELAHDGVTLVDEATGETQTIKVVHRDLKPQNIFLVPTALGDLVKVIDFGIAKIRNLQAEHTSLTNMFLGTCHYAAPEQLEGSQNLDARADIYSLGLMLYEMLTGVDPFGFNFRENRVSVESWLFAHASKTPLPLRSQPNCDHLSETLEAVVMGCLNKSPDDRFSSVRELSEALSSAISLDPAKQLPQGNHNKPLPNPSIALDQETVSMANNSQATQRKTSNLTRSSGFAIKWGQCLLFTLVTLILGIGMARFVRTPITPSLTEEKEEEINALHPTTTLTGHRNGVWSVVLSSNGKLAVSGGEDKTVRVWNTETGSLLQTFSGHGDGVRSVTVSHDGNVIASASADQTIKLWNTATGELIRTLTAHQDSLWSVEISPDQQIIASASADETIKLWNMATAEVIRTLRGHSGWVFSATFSPDGKRLASGGKDGTVKLWDVQTGQMLQTLSDHQDAVRSVAFSPDGNYLASGSWDGTVKVWEMATGKVLSTFSEHSDRIVAVTFSRDGQRLVSGSIDETLQVWDWQNQRLLDTLTDHRDWVLSVATGPSGEMISSSRQPTIKIWRGLIESHSRQRRQEVDFWN
ncbi:WD-40 repeat-containing serine/threonine protein kinase [Crocosphaera subtropica ATCC 51142]|uniref:WD-40 repeat-containing serine/threonine protein kinase n=1 Tax=Crocosphaera subtropica (strain ATCC 51142 / BH68) TaxID=43989 RepID=B1WNU5_CROS5|nr:serine/threonine-protein kinase [Crocosphaera subtropica]ACB51524.1 WD-40 repeat-containing serine/threonine protein kinase [Crocosphaera subtropica ATCC 51142]